MNAYRQDVDPLEALGETTRRSIVEGLRDGERTVGDLAASLPVSRPAVSQHLGVLRAAGLVLERPEGTRRWYRLDPIGLVRLHARLDAMWGLEADGGPPAATAPAAAAAPPAAAAAPPAARPVKPKRSAAASAAAGELAGPEPPRPAERPAKGERKKRKKKGGRK